jgi:hypothetical protein
MQDPDIEPVSGMKRTALARKTPLKRKPWRKALGTPETRLSFKEAVCSTSCLMKDNSRVPCRGPLQAAHMLPKRLLRELGYGAEVIYDPASSVSLCEGHHTRHDFYVERVPAELLPVHVVQFAAELGLSYALRREDFWQ